MRGVLLEFVYSNDLIAYLQKKDRRYVVVEVVSSNHSDIEITELYPHVITDKQAAAFLKKCFVTKPAPVGQVLLPPYRLHYADTVTFSLRSFLGVKSLRQEGITL